MDVSSTERFVRTHKRTNAISKASPQIRRFSEDIRKTALQHRLKDLVILELTKDGHKGYQHMTLRSLYNYVLEAITTKTNHNHGVADRRATFVPNTPIMPPKENLRASFDSTTPQISKEVTYRERLGGYLHPRDMRRLVTPFSSSNEPELIVRRHVVLLNFDPLRAIVLRDRMLVFVPDGADSILMNLEKRVRCGASELEESLFGHNGSIKGTPSDQLSEDNNKEHQYESLSKAYNTKPKFGYSPDSSPPNTSLRKSDSSTELSEEEDNFDDNIDDNNDEFDELNQRKWIDMPFELQCIDGILQSVSALLSEEVETLEHSAHDILENLLDPSKSSIEGDGAQDTLRRLKNNVGEMVGTVQGVVRAMNLVLDEDEDLALMNLSRLITHPERFIQPVPAEVLQEESDEPELILEAYLQQGLSSLNALNLLKGNIATADEQVNQKLDSIRNRLLYVNTIVSLLSLIVAAASLVGAFMGMNVTVPGEGMDDVFGKIVGYTTAGSIVLLILLLLLFLKIGALPRNL